MGYAMFFGGIGVGVSQRGVTGDRLRPAGFGEYRLLPEHAATDRRQRRVEIVRTF